MGFRHSCRDGSAHGHDGEGKEGEDVLGVHFDRRGLREDWGWGVVWMVCWSLRWMLGVVDVV